MSVFERLRSIPLFAELAESDLRRICADVSEIELAPGEVLFSEGDEGDAAFLIVGGEVEVVVDDGRRETRLAGR
ncbi:MAG: cyclic nucleotide-binding domain-containing protein, partial [Acidimicrobiia bacterium]